MIANLAPQILFGKLLPDGAAPSRSTERMRSFRNGPGTMMVHLAVDALPNWRAGEELKRFAYVHLAPSMDTMARVYQDAIAGLLPGRAGPRRRPADRHRSFARAGRKAHSVGAGAHASRRIRAAMPRARSPAPTGTRSRRPMADRVVDIVERYAPGLQVARSSAARSSRPTISSARMPISSAATVSMAAIISTRISSSGRCPAGRATACRSRISGSSVRPPGPAPGVGAGSGFMAAKMLAGS